MNQIALVFVIAQIVQASNSADPPLIEPEPGLYSVYKNFQGPPIYMMIPTAAERAQGIGIDFFDWNTASEGCRQQGSIMPQPYIIPDQVVGAMRNGVPVVVPKPGAGSGISNSPIKSALRHLSRGMRAAGQSLAPSGGNSVSAPVQAVPLVPPAPMQFAPMQRPITVSPGVNLMNGPTYTIWP